MRPISNVVDVTNYVMLERCRPLHAFDLARMEGRGILVRLAREGERITTLDGVDRPLRPEDLLICDARGTAQAIAGIMGGATAEVSDETTEIILESAYFEPSGIARTSKRLGLRSEASARFERGVDPSATATGADRAMALLAEVAGADVAPGMLDVYPQPVERSRIAVRAPRVNAVLGTALAAADMRALLPPLGIDVEGEGDEFVAVAPTWRPDLEREIDIAEEVARRVGLDAIPRTVPSNPAKTGALTPAQRERRAVVDVLVGAGYDETYTLPLVAPADLARAGAGELPVIEVENPLRAEESVLRPRLLPGLLRAAAFNASHGAPDVALFEAGTVFLPPAPDSTLPDERLHVAGVLTGQVRRRPHEDDRPVSAFDAVTAVEAIAAELRLADFRIESDSPAGFHPARAARVLVDGADAGIAGEVASEVCAALDVARPAVAFELDLGRLLAGARRSRLHGEVSRFPASNVDLAFVVPERVAAGDVERTLRAAGGDLVEDVALFDVFRSDALGPGAVSLAFAVRFRAPDRTLTDDEVRGLRARLIAAVERAHDATLRG
jgi:phenylalanyl-tRNA synthetase beta chain